MYCCHYPVQGLPICNIFQFRVRHTLRWHSAISSPLVLLKCCWRLCAYNCVSYSPQSFIFYVLDAFSLKRGRCLFKVCVSPSFCCALIFTNIFRNSQDYSPLLPTSQVLLWSAYFGQSDSAALESSDMTCWALMLLDTPPLLYESVCVSVCASNSAWDLGQSSVSVLALHSNKWQWLDLQVCVEKSLWLLFDAVQNKFIFYLFHLS